MGSQELEVNVKPLRLFSVATRKSGIATIMLTPVVMLMFVLEGCSQGGNPFSPGQTGSLTNLLVTSLALSGVYVVAATGLPARIYISADNGAHWSFTAGFPVDNKSPSNDLESVTSVTLLSAGSYLFAGIGGGYSGSIYTSVDHGFHWSQRDPSFRQDVNCFLETAGVVYAGTNNGVYRSTDNGANWSAINFGLDFGSYDSTYHHAPQVLRLAVLGSDLFAGTSGEGIFRSTDGGNYWTPCDNRLTNLNIYGLATDGRVLFAGAFQFPGDSTGGMYASLDYGNTWSRINNGLSNHMVDDVTAVGADILVSTNQGVFFSDNLGQSWVPILNLGTMGVANAFLVNRPYLLVASEGVIQYPLSKLSGVAPG